MHESASPPVSDVNLWPVSEVDVWRLPIVEAIPRLWLGYQGLELVWLGYGCCYCYRSSKVCPADITLRPVQVSGPREMADHTCGTQGLRSVEGQAYENRRQLPSRTRCCNCCCSPRQKTCTEHLHLHT